MCVCVSVCLSVCGCIPRSDEPSKSNKAYLWFLFRFIALYWLLQTWPTLDCDFAAILYCLLSHIYLCINTATRPVNSQALVHRTERIKVSVIRIETVCSTGIRAWHVAIATHTHLSSFRWATYIARVAGPPWTNLHRIPLLILYPWRCQLPVELTLLW